MTTKELSFSKSAVLHELVTTLLVLSGGRFDKYKCFAGVSNPCNRNYSNEPRKNDFGGFGGRGGGRIWRNYYRVVLLRTMPSVTDSGGLIMSLSL